MWALGTFAILFLASAFISPTFIQRNAYSGNEKMTSDAMTSKEGEQMTSGEMVQQLTETNVPVTLPLTRGFVNGHEVFYITTEASEKAVADHLTNLTGSRVVHAPTLKSTPADSLANIYEFKNGIEGTGPQGFQPNVADSQPGDVGYSPLWRINLVEWKQDVMPRELRSEDDILAAQDKGDLSIKPADVVVNCPFVQWNGGSLKVRQDKTLTDETAYGDGQVLNIDIDKMEVTLVGHRGFSPDGSTIYYIATDASVKEVADALGIVFANKTGSTLKSGASSDLFVFTNGIKGSGPMGFQASIAGTDVGDEAYSPLWRIQTVTWNNSSEAEFLRTVQEISSKGSDGKIKIDIAGAVVNCPFVEVDKN